MSTRCNIILVFGSTKVFLFRRQDGQLSDTGKSLAEHLMKTHFVTPKMLEDQPLRPDPGEFLASLLNDRYEKASYEAEARPIYELTTDMHGDIEYLYVFNFPHGSGELEISIKRRFPESHVSMSEIMASTYSVESFFTAVNNAITELNTRIARMNAENGTNYGKQDYLPEVAKLKGAA